MEPVLLYITTANREEAISLSRELLSDRIVACTNIMEHVTSMYHWQGEVEHTPEVIVIAKTLRLYIERITERVKKQSSYSNPCILAVPVLGGSAEYIEWMKDEVKPL